MGEPRFCVILCGGKSSRFGRDKAVEPFLGEPSMTHFCFKRYSRIFSQVFVCAKSQKFSPPLPLIKDDFEDFSPMGALYSALKGFAGEKVFIVPADTPFVSEEAIRALWESRAEISLASDGEKTHNLCGFFSGDLAERALKFYRENNHKIGEFITSCDSEILKFKDKAQFLNINYESDLEKVEN
ncbi:MAG: molybdenum cofactor guanylyltransferase [Campylobacter sp.]|nr:molybdenum cofactor guanylyltransferase [Campylobacter sp.]